jgi:hypothetical protein
MRQAFKLFTISKMSLASVDSTLASAIARSLKLCDTLFANDKAFFRSSAIFSNGIKGHPESPSSQRELASAVEKTSS